MGKRVGKFVISECLVEDAPSTVQALMGKLIVIRCEHRYADGCFHYTALCDEFEEVPVGNVIPKYAVIGTTVGDKVVFKFNKG
jgi:hypothetical protein